MIHFYCIPTLPLDLEPAISSDDGSISFELPSLTFSVSQRIIPNTWRQRGDLTVSLLVRCGCLTPSYLLTIQTHKERLATLVLSKSQQFMTEPPPEASKARKNKTDENAQRPHTGPSLLLNPTFFNNPRIREASIPAANGHFSARGLCKLYSVLEKEARQGGSTGGLMEGGDWAEHIKNGSGRGFGGMAKDSSIQGGNAKFVGGFTVYPREEGDSEMPCFGHGGVGGSIAFCDPSNGLSIAVTLNRLTMQTSSTSGRIVAKVYETLGLSAPLQFADGDVLNRGNNQAVVDAEVVLAT